MTDTSQVIGIRLPVSTIVDIDIKACGAGQSRSAWIRHVIDQRLMAVAERTMWRIVRVDGHWGISDGKGNYIYPKIDTIEAAWELRDEMNNKTGGEV